MPEDKKSLSHDLLYLERLNFRPELRKTWLNFFVSNFRVVLLLIFLISAWGVWSFFRLPRESNPEVKIPIAVVITTYPGVGPSDIEELVTKKLEAPIAGLKDIKSISSNSLNSVSTISVEFEASADLESSIRSLRDRVADAKNDLPADANDPVVREISFDDQPILTVELSGPYDGFTLRNFAEEIQKELEKIPDIREIVVSGGDQLEIEVAYDPERLVFFGLTADQANQAIRATNLALPAGSFEGREYTYPVRGDARLFTSEAIANLPVTHTDNGAIVYLKDLAEVKEKAIKRTVYSRFSLAGQPSEDSVSIDVVKKTGGNILAATEEAKRIVAEKVRSFPSDLKYDITLDFGEIIQENFDQLGHDFLITIILVFGILFLLVGLKEAVVAGLAVPLTFGVTFGVMDLTGITLNFLSIFSLLLSLGLLVDDAIVVVSATKQYMRSGKFTPEEAVLLVLNDFKVVLTTTSLTTIWAFLPLIFASGIIGQFIKSVPIVVSVTLTSSLLIALMINHPLAAVLERIRLTKKLFFALMAVLIGAGYLFIAMASLIGYFLLAAVFVALLVSIRWYFYRGRHEMEQNSELMSREWRDDELIKKKLRDQTTGEGDFLARLFHGVLSISRVLPLYERILCRILTDTRLRKRVLIGAFVLFLAAVAMPASGLLPSEFFPSSDEKLVFINMRASTGLNLDETNKIAARAEEILLRYPEIKNYSVVSGRSGAGNNIGGASASTNLSNFTINLIDQDRRELKSYEIADRLRRDLEAIREATFTVESAQGGPPSGAAFEAQIKGDDLNTIDKISRDLKPILTAIPGVVDADISLKDSPAEYTFTFDPARLELYNLNAAYAGSVLRLAIAGNEVSTVIREGEEIKVIARFAEDRIPTLESIQNIQILNLRKQPVFLKDVAKIELKPSVESITRIDQKRTIILSAGVQSPARPNDVVAEFQGKVAAEYRLPDGYTIEYGGQNEQNADSVTSILQAMVLAGLLIIATLVIQFNSFKESIIVLVTIPLALIGVFFGLTVFRLSLSFPGLIGILALFGIVVKNAIILIDKMNLNLKFGIPFEAALVDAGKSRLEAIFITSISTIFGIIPITLSNEIWRALGTAIIFGLMLSSFLTLFIVPILYQIFMKKDYRGTPQDVPSC